MSPVKTYKKMESRAMNALLSVFRFIGSFFFRIFRGVYMGGRQKFTVMLIPHSEKKIFNFQISVFSLVSIGALLAVVLVAFFGLSSNYTGTHRLLDERSRKLQSTEASLEQLREEVQDLQDVAGVFERTLSNTLNVLGIEDNREQNMNPSDGDLSALFGVEQVDSDSLREIEDLKRLSSYLEDAVEPLGEISSVLMSHRELMVDIPSLWPLKGVRGRVTQEFGPASHPFTGQWYLHKGMDIAFGYGVPIVATANGKVVKIDYDYNGFGNFIIIRHKYGFYTRYAHMQRIDVRKGQDVERGEVIGAMGNSGLSTGPHLHYEVRIGSQVVDPNKYLNISTNLAEPVDFR
ncbi:MAG: M23 family metallopeptidase [Spirochaetales bacterium]|nr:M23 family metallopeptidase [Spirochaetales bacterium]MCF7938629.1 M23 family metallopeptidase [Spirochaetales bacterium]